METLDTIFERETEDDLGNKIAYQVPITAYRTKSQGIIVNSPGSRRVQRRASRTAG